MSSPKDDDGKLPGDMNSKQKFDLDDETDEMDSEDRLADEERKEREKRQRQLLVQRRKDEMRRKALEKSGNSNEFPSQSLNPNNNNNKSFSTQNNSLNGNGNVNGNSNGGSGSIREDIVEQSVNFLNHPKVKTAPSSQKQEFLIKKGLTKEEIAEAIKRANLLSSSQPQQQMIQQQPQQMGQYNNNYPPQQQGYIPPRNNMQVAPPPPRPAWYSTSWGLASTIISVAALGAGAIYVSKKFIFPYLLGDSKATAEAAKRAEEEKKKKEEESQLFKKEIADTVGAVQNQTKELKDMVQAFISKQQEQQIQNSIQPQLPGSSVKSNGWNSQSSSGRSTSNEDVKIQELQAQVNRLRTMVMDQQLFSSPSSSYPPITQQQPQPQQQQSSYTTTTQTTSFSPAPSSANNQSSSFMSPIGKQNSSSNVISTPIQPTPAPTNSGLPAWQLESSNKKQTTTTTTTTTTTQPATPSSNNAQSEENPYSNKYAQIAEMVRKGETPADVRNIDDSPINAKVERGQKNAPSKPWERNGNGVRNGNDSLEVSKIEEVVDNEPTESSQTNQ